MFVVGQQMQRLAAALSLDSGEPPAAKEWLEVARRWLEWSGGDTGPVEGHALWADYHREVGERDTPRSHPSRRFATRRAASASSLLTAHRLLGELDTGCRSGTRMRLASR